MKSPCTFSLIPTLSMLLAAACSSSSDGSKSPNEGSAAPEPSDSSGMVSTSNTLGTAGPTLSSEPGANADNGGANGNRSGATNALSPPAQTTANGGASGMMNDAVDDSGGSGSMDSTQPNDNGVGNTPASGGNTGVDNAAMGNGGGSSVSPVDCSGIESSANWQLCEAGPDYCTAVYSDGAGCDAVCAAVGLECAEVWENADGSCAPDTGLPQLSCGQGTAHDSDFCRCAGAGGVVQVDPNPDGMMMGDGMMDSSSGGSGSSPMPGQISINDPTPGYASVSGGTTGGGTDLSSAVTVTSMSALQAAAGGSNSAIILVQPGDYSGSLEPGANKTIIGVAPGAKITGRINISGEDHNNIIIRNIAVQGEHCNTYDECKSGADGVYVGHGAHHVWLDHLDVSDGQDGNCDMTRGADYVTVSWTNFYYTYDKEHRFSNLIAGSDDEPESVGKLHITYMTSHWGSRVDQRQPRGRFGNIHMLNNYHNTGGSQIHGVGKDMALIAENSVYEEKISIWKDMGSPRGWKGIGNIGSGSDLNDSRGTVFDIPYEYSAMPAADVVDAVTSSECGAGNTCTLAQ